MGIVVRLLLVIFAYALACVAASMVLTIGAVAPEWNDWTASGVQSIALWSIVAVGAVVISAVAMLPTLLVIVLAEGFAWRSILIYAAIGGALSLGLCYGLDFSGRVGELSGALARQRELLAAAGIAGGSVYWLFAGHTAGSWKSG